MNTAYCRDCREFTTTTWFRDYPESTERCDACGSDNIVQAEDVLDAEEHMLGRRGEDI